MSSSISITIGRILLGVYFLLPGLMKFANWDATLELMTLHKIPFEGPLVGFSAIVNIVGGVVLIANRGCAGAPA
jgi:putative oxidoreductase